MRNAGRLLPSDVKFMCLSKPSRYDDFINMLCFLDNRNPVNLIDVGANIGEFTQDFLLFFPKAIEAICFEPLSQLASDIARNTNDERVKIVSAALGSSKQKAVLKFPYGITSQASFHSYTAEANAFYGVTDRLSEEVDVMTLDEICATFSASHPFILKIDTQGHEIDVLRGGKDTIRRASIAIVECSFAPEYDTPPPSFSEVCKLLYEADLHPVVFQGYNKHISTYAFERDVIFVKSNLLGKIYYQNYR